VFGLTKKSKPVVGLDIGSSAVKAVELRSLGKGYRVTAVGIEPIPPDSIVDGAIIDGTPSRTRSSDCSRTRRSRARKSRRRSQATP